MKKKLYTGMVGISATVIFVTMVVTIGLFYNLFTAQVMDDLKTHVHILKSTEAVLEYIEQDYDPQIDNLRITVIDADGNVNYDSNADIGSMDNHGDRPEVQEALETGQGEAVRRSDTLDTNTYYYAELMDDGWVIRVAKEAGSIWNFFIKVIPVLLIELALAVVICVVTARILAKKMVEPIEVLARNLDGDKDLKADTYEEIQPFVDKIHSQHKALKESSKMRQEFTANVSHELKTPLASISGYAELIETGMAKDEDIQHFASEIHKSSIRLLALINDIIELSHLDVMDDEMQTQPVNLSEEAVNCVNMLKMNGEKHDVNIVADAIEKDCIIDGNQEMISEVVYNLCDNAIRYNKPNGHVWVSVLREDGNVVLQVKDDGIGIPEKDQGRIFERFYRVDKTRSKKTGGTGLGLAIVKHIAQQHHADIKLDSKENQGTTISVTFPQ